MNKFIVIKLNYHFQQIIFADTMSITRKVCFITYESANNTYIIKAIIYLNYDSIIFVDVSTRIGFTAGVTSYSTSWSSGTLVFPKVITNVGNGYNPSDGVFTAPMAGVYVFFVNVQGYSTYSIYVDIVLNGATKVRTAAEASSSDYYEAGPNLAVLSLQTGDRVWVKYNRGQSYYSDSDSPMTTFSGFLI